MSSIFGRLKNNAGNQNAATTASPAKKGAPTAPLTPLEVIIAATGDAKGDGSDKFFGMHNPSNTCYCNSVVQCLYFSTAFREQMITFPIRTPRDKVVPPTQTQNAAGAPTTPASPAPAEDEVTARVNEYFGLVPSKRPAPAQTPAATPGIKPEDNKDTFEYLKKTAVNSTPFLAMESSNNTSYGMPESLFTGLKDLFEGMIVHDARTGVIAPTKFLEVLRANFELYRSPQHQDAHEFLNLLLNEVVEQVEQYSKKTLHSQSNGTATTTLTTPSTTPTKLNGSWVHDLFEGTLTSETRCLTCENVSQRDEIFLDLSVDLEDNSSVSSCLRKFSEEEMLCERNKFHCDRCGGLQEAEKRMKIKRLPRILALHLKRFKYVEEINRMVKLFHRVVFPFYLRLLNTSDDAEDPDRLYELYAIVVHLGSTPFHGHYVAIIKTKLGGWLLFDDELVLPVDKDYVKNYFGGDPRNPACAYVLFYQETTEDAVFREQDTSDPAPGDIVSVTPAEAAAMGVNLANAGSPILAPIVTQPKSSGLEGEELLLNGHSTPGAPYHSQTSTNFIPDGVPSKHPVPMSRSSNEIHEDTHENLSDFRPEKPGRGLSAFKSGSLKIRTPSITLRQKPKLWGVGKSDKHNETKDPADNHVNAVEEALPADNDDPPLLTAIPLDKNESRFRLNRFSIGRKKSSIAPA